MELPLPSPARPSLVEGADALELATPAGTNTADTTLTTSPHNYIVPKDADGLESDPTDDNDSRRRQLQLGAAGMARRTLGLTLLMVVVFLWTMSSFLASVSIGAGNSFLSISFL